MVRLKKLVCSGLFSYTSESPIELSDHVVLVGPNNAGKSNLFRIIRVLSDALYGEKRHLSGNEMSQASGDPFVEAEITLSPDECSILSEYLVYQPIGEKDDVKLRPQRLPDQVKTLDFLDSIKIRIVWTRTIENLGTNPSVDIWFLKCGFGLNGPLHGGNLTAVRPDGSAVAQDTDKSIMFNKFWNLIFKDGDPNKGSALFFKQGGTIVHTPIPLSPDIIDKLPEAEKAKAHHLRHQLQYRDSQPIFNLSNVLGVILSKKIIHASENHNLLPEPITEKYGLLQEPRWFNDEFKAKYNDELWKRLLYASLCRTETLMHDGSNMAQLLFSLKNSPRLSERKRFQRIQEEFGKVFQNQKLSFDVSLSYKQKPNSTPNDTHDIPKFPEISVAELDFSEHVPWDQVGSGVREVLYLLTVAHGIENSVVLLDEPGIHLHPSMLKTVMATIEPSNSDSQFLIITHLPDLLSQEMFDKKGHVVYIKKTNNQSVIYSLDSKAKKKFSYKPQNLKHLIDPRIFFANLVILVEGESDRIILEIARGTADSVLKYDLSLKNIITIPVYSKYNFPTYVDLLEAYGILYIILADQDSKKDVFKGKQIGEISEKGIKPNGCIFLIKEGKIENLMGAIDPKIFTEAEKKTKSKVGIALEFCKMFQSQHPKNHLPKPIAEFLEYCTNKVSGKSQ